MYKRSTRLVLSTVIISLAFLGLALAGCAGSPKAGTMTVPEDFPAYYVRADGSDFNDGLSEAAPFRTLTKALDAANKGKIKTVTVLGTLNLESEGENSQYSDYVFNITDTRRTEITIRGKEGADEAEHGVLSGAGAGKAVIAVGEESRVRLEHLRVEGGSSERSGAGIQVRGQAQITLGEGTLVRNNHSQSGGGVAIGERGNFTMEGGEISGNTAQGGGGGVVMEGGSFTMRGGEISGNKSSMSGGGVAVAGGSFTMLDGLISGNTAQANGGGVVLRDGSFTMENGKISGNNTTQGSGGGVAVTGGTFTMKGGEISGKNTAQGGGGVGINTMTGGKFIKTGGTIDATNSAGTGSVVYIHNGFSYRKRDSAAGPNINLDSSKYGSAGGWE
jgi:hypothetical protein